MIQTITPFLWFENNDAEEAMSYYVSVFPNSRIIHIERYPKEQFGPMPNMAGKVLTGIFELNGQQFMAIDGGKVPGFSSFSGAVSFMITCNTQEEIDHYWHALSAVPEAEQCGWCKDKFGLIWQVTPDVLSKMFTDPDRAKARRAMDAMLKMKKIVIADLERAFSGQ